MLFLFSEKEVNPTVEHGGWWDYKKDPENILKNTVSSFKASAGLDLCEGQRLEFYLKCLQEQLA